jgi:hypothetical protein
MGSIHEYLRTHFHLLMNKATFGDPFERDACGKSCHRSFRSLTVRNVSYSVLSPPKTPSLRLACHLAPRQLFIPCRAGVHGCSPAQLCDSILLPSPWRQPASGPGPISLQDYQTIDCPKQPDGAREHPNKAHRRGYEIIHVRCNPMEQHPEFPVIWDLLNQK